MFHVDHVKMHASSVLTTSFPEHFFRTSVPCIIHPELRDASVLVLCFLTGSSDFVVDFVKTLTEIHGVLSDACLLVTCLVTNER